MTEAAEPRRKAIILIVEADAPQALLLEGTLGADDRELRTVTDAHEALALARQGADLVVAEHRLSGMSGIELVRRLREEKLAIPAIIVSREANTKVVVEAMKAGALDFVQKPFDASFLRARAAQALELRHANEELELLRRKIQRRRKADSIIGVSEAIAQVRRLIGTVARTDVAVAIYGETGTGKELAARTLHEQSERTARPFVVVDCAALPESLLENELFGHEAGSFTGADRRTAGLLAEADGGTVFIDEIGEMPLPLQAKLLRFLQTKEFRRVGGAQQTRVDVRVVIATHRDLEKAVAAREFREDLYYRINVFPLRVPALRERREDIPLLASHFLHANAREVRRPIDGFTPEALSMLAAFDWPGNVRQLENVVRRLAVLADGDRIGVAGCELVLGPSAPGRAPPALGDYREARERALATFERDYLSRVLRDASGNVAEAARRSGLDRKTFWTKLKRYGVTRSEQ